MDSSQAQRQARTAGILLGIGLGGFVDGILLHQIAQWHNLLSARLPPTTMEAMRTNMAADGWFHVAVWIATAVGVFLLYGAARQAVALPPARWLVGLLFLGWGGFNLAEGIVDHHLLELHHVRDLPRHLPLYDYAFLLVGGLGFLVLGWLLTHPERRLAGRRATRTL